ncbi:MAG: MBL fold metallo-hydrolase [Gammaproteobacteria bacterium]|nr:MBL fold metallo-hydrolase [Gammaproteobacteria bacterium]MDH3448330.1 MBL fold metallo-hydrolase [Gammaproteobacteria bacterium]
MKRLLALFSILTALPGAAYAEFDYPMRAQAVSKNVYAIITPTRELPNADNGGWNSNSAFIVTGSGVLLFDSGSSTGIGRAIRETIATVTPQPVRWIVNSHAHGDHWLGNAAFDDSVEQIFATAEVIEEIGRDGAEWIDRFARMTGGVTGDSAILAPDRPVDRETELSLGGEPIVLMLSGGSHSPGDLMLWLPREKILISGDVVYSDRMPSTNAGDLKQWIGMLDQLKRLQPRLVIPGHGAVTDISGLERLHRLLTELWTVVEAGVDEGLSDFEMLPRVSAALESFKPFYPGLDDKLRRDLSHVFLQVEAAAFQ